ncbi:hypothetical protein Golax_022957 [Gossypium laxum]|uniref:DUF4283 domain-containing protein n=1 Tax=Gossypium laxum TaxID=34288 RepID=A0A7J9B072_9ROSI|nr:hypothetical protein [Gossypium laxum]
MMDDAMANMRLLDDEEEAIQEIEGVVSTAYQFCLVGRCLTDSIIHFPSLRNTMADLWHPIGGICITEWRGENSAAMELNLTEFWVQVHDLQPGLMNVSMAKQFGDFCGNFIEYDTFIPTLGLQMFLRICVCLDVTALLKRKKKVLIGKMMCINENFAGVNHEFSINEGKDLRGNVRGVKPPGLWNWSRMRRMTQLLCWKGKNGRELGKVHGFLWIISWDQVIWIFRLALGTSAAGSNENTKLERSWLGETTNC